MAALPNNCAAARARYPALPGTCSGPGSDQQAALQTHGVTYRCRAAARRQCICFHRRAVVLAAPSLHGCSCMPIYETHPVEIKCLLLETQRLTATTFAWMVHPQRRRAGREEQRVCGRLQRLPVRPSVALLRDLLRGGQHPAVQQQHLRALRGGSGHRRQRHRPHRGDEGG